MRLLAVVLAGWACTGHGHPVHMTPTHQAGISGRGPEPKDSLASLLMVRGGMSGLDEGQTGYVRRGHSEIYDMKGRRTGRSWLDDVNHGYVHRGTSGVGGVRGGSLESRPRTPSGSTTVKTATEDFRDANVRVGWAPEGGAVHETVRFPSRIRKSMDNYETEDFRDVHVRRGTTLQ
mmetsp:Transcript_76385/g.145374  ORF Transcript_76385/g.145374 Transcript_76385/m.145374 type:complete len:176 (-) Transcript_76385:138-665(-)